MYLGRGERKLLCLRGLGRNAAAVTLGCDLTHIQLLCNAATLCAEHDLDHMRLFSFASCWPLQGRFGCNERF